MKMCHRQFFPLLLSIAFGISVHAQTKPNTSQTSKKPTTTDNNKTSAVKPGTTVKKPVSTTSSNTSTASKKLSTVGANKTSSVKKDTTVKKSLATETLVKDLNAQKQTVTPAPSQAATEKTTTESTTAVVEPVKKDDEAIKMPSPFKGGTLRVSNQSRITLYRFNRKSINPGKDNDLSGTLSMTWFPVNGLGIGVDARYNSSFSNTPGSSSDYKTWSTYFHLIYGYSFNDRYHAYVKVGYGPSKGDSKTSNGLNRQRLKSSFKDIVISAGAPIRIEKNGTFFVIPAFSYDKYKGKAGTHDIGDKTTAFTIKLNSFLPLSFNGNQQPKNYYAKGTQYIDYNSNFDWHSTTRDENQGTIKFAPRKYKTRFFRAGYGLYVVDNVAAGLNIELSRNKDITPGSADDIRKYVSIQPSIIAQVPVKGPLNNLFGQVSYEFSRGSQTGKIKTKESNVDLRVGYHLFVAKNLALTPRIGYTIEKYTANYTTSGDLITKSKGLAGELMLRAWLDWKWMK